MIQCYMTVPFGEFDEAIIHLDEAARIGSALDLEEPKLFGLTHTANTLTYMTDFDGARQAANQALQLAEELGNRKWQSELLGLSVPIHHLRDGDLDAATQTAQSAANIAGHIGAAEQEAYAHITLGQVSWLRGDYQRAISHYDEALRAGRTSGLPFLQVAALCGLGTTHMDISSGLIEKTIRFHSEALELLEQPLGTVTGGMAWADLGFCVLATGNIEQAGDFFQKGLTTPTAFKFLARPMLLVGSAFVALGRQDTGAAAALVHEAREFSEERAMKHFFPLVALAEANVSLASGDTGRALESFNRAERLAREMNMRPLLWQACAGAAEVLDKLGRQGESTEKRSGALSAVHEIAGLFEDQNLRSMYLEDALKKLG